VTFFEFIFVTRNIPIALLLCWVIWGFLPEIKYGIIWFLDWVIDVRVLDHRFPKYCDWLAEHPWWGDKK
jgi:hypothetical protein